MTDIYKVLDIHKKKLEKSIDSSFYSPKTGFLAIFANFGQLWMVVYTAIIKIFGIFKLYRMGIGVT